MQFVKWRLALTIPSRAGVGQEIPQGGWRRMIGREDHDDWTVMKGQSPNFITMQML